LIHPATALLLAATAALFVAADAAVAKPTEIDCTVIIDSASGEVLVSKGVCDKRFSPASTFKVPLAVMGFDSGFLTDRHTPAIDYDPAFDAPKRDRKTVDPIIWERDSIIWYSRQITKALGADRFARYVRDLDYGNADVSGTPGKDDTLTRSWVDSSLTISPQEQVSFIQRLLSDRLPVSAAASAQARSILPTFKAGAWTVTGKTGSTRLRGTDGQAIGWFVGWADRDGRRIAFARLVVNGRKDDLPKGPSTRASFLKALPGLVR
jgi:beta-lactamase class D